MTFIKLNNNLISLGGKLLSVPSILPTPQVIYDSNTVAWYDSTDLNTITKDGNDYVSLWKDKLNSGHDLIQNIGTSQPKWISNDGVLFDADFMKTTPFIFNQPEMFYIVLKINHLGTASNTIIDGNSITERGILWIWTTYSPIYYILYAGTVSGSEIPFSIGEFKILRVLFNSTNSIIKSMETVSNTLNPGTGNIGGIRVGSNILNADFGYMTIKEIIARKVADNTTDETNIYNYLKTKYSL